MNPSEESALSKTCNILISSAGRRVALARLCRNVLDELGLSGMVLATDMSPWSAAYHDVDRAFAVRRCTDESFVPDMLKLCREHEVRLLIPTIDTELPVLAEARGVFEEQGTVVLVPDPRIVSIARDKRLTHQWLTAAGLPTVRQGEVDVVLARPEEWTFPVFIKPVAGSGSGGIGVASDVRHLEALASRGEMIVQSMARGVEYSLDVFHDLEGRCRAVVPRRRIETRAGEISKGVTERMPSLEALAREAIESIEAHALRTSTVGASDDVARSAMLPLFRGVTNLQVFVDSQTGRFQIIELNARFPGGYPLTHHAGGCYLTWIVMQVMGMALPQLLPEWREGVAMLRFDDAVFTTIDQIERPKA
ncbi:MAG: ATP-grasp domain-containing protein [Phycisphaeraceae bacterium]|nr:ATP-grasp domain-containing protein [Phycisphaeraceae bacterium]